MDWGLGFPKSRVPFWGVYCFHRINSVFRSVSELPMNKCLEGAQGAAMRTWASAV